MNHLKKLISDVEIDCYESNLNVILTALDAYSILSPFSHFALVSIWKNCLIRK